MSAATSKYKFNIPIIDAYVFVSFEKDFNKGKIQVEKFIGSDSDVDNAEAYVCSCGHRIGVWLGNNPKRDVIVHEALHVVQDAYDYIGASMGKENELDAFFLGYVVKRIFECHDKYKKSISLPN